MAELTLYHHQRRVFELLMAGRNVILQAPTGSGKTHAALYPFLYPYTVPDASKFREFMPPTCIYSVPMRVLANQFVAQYKKASKFFDEKYGKQLKVRIQTGENPDDRRLEGDLIFATIDQTLSSYLHSPYSLPKRLANINAAAVASAYLVFDEFHLFDPDSTLPTTLEMLRRLNGVTPFVLMTATFSRDMLDGLSQYLNAEVVPSNPEDVSKMESLATQVKKHRTYKVASSALNAKQVLDAHDRRSLVICNTVDRARYLFEELKANAPQGVTVRLLHSRYLPEDRKTTEEAIRANFAKGATDGSEIIVSTQAIEVGVDITSQVLHTELAPANAILQRAGRCARYEDDRGRVIIYQTATNPDGSEVDLLEKPAPYNSRADLFQPTLDAFNDRAGQHLKFSDEQEIITTVHGPADQALLQQVRGSMNTRDAMYWVMRGDSQRDDVSQLVRKVIQQPLIIHPNPDAVLEAPFSVPSFGLHPGTLQGYVKNWLERGEALQLDWCIKYLKELRDDDQTQRTQYQWGEVNDPQEALMQPLLCVNPELAYYDKTLGLLADRGGKWDTRLQLPERRDPAERPIIRYRLETYEKHIKLVYDAFLQSKGSWKHYEPFATRLEQRFGWNADDVYTAAQLAVLLHDVGKLSVKWQNWVRDYQTRIEGQYDPAKAYAHTELQTDEHARIESDMPRRPWHAVESALAGWFTVMNVLGEEHPLCPAIFSAIARHHAPFSGSHQKYQLRGDAEAHVRATFAEHLPAHQDKIELISQADAMPKSTTHDLIIHPNDWTHDEGDYAEGAFIAYQLLARVLRNADQIGTQRGTE